MPVSLEDLAARLRARRDEIEQALLARTGTPGGGAVDEPEYRGSFRSTIPAAFDFCLGLIESPDGEAPPVPADILRQARLAARHRVGLDTVLCGYVAGGALLDDFILDECDSADVRVLLRARNAAFDHLLSRISAEYRSERKSRDSSREAQARERVQRLLRGEPQSDADLGYLLAANHVGLVISGVDSKQMVAEVAAALDSRLLIVTADAETVWGWLGRTGPIHTEKVQELVASRNVSGNSVGIGELAAGTVGWRHTHRQARAALQVARSSGTGVARYADVCLIASAMQDPLLATSLWEMYVQPIRVGKDEGEVHLQTLRAYFASHRNGKSTASALGISRQAVASRLRVVEERLGKPLPACATAVEVALDLENTRRQEEHGSR